MNDYCEKCQRTVSFLHGYNQWYNPNIDKFWTAYICDKCGTLVSQREICIDSRTLIDRHPNAIFLVGTIFGLLATPIFVTVTDQVIFSIAMVWGIVISTTVILRLLDKKYGVAKKVAATTFAEVMKLGENVQGKLL